MGLLAALLCWARGKKEHEVTYVTKNPQRAAPPKPNKEFVINKYEDEANVEAEIERKLQAVMKEKEMENIERAQIEKQEAWPSDTPGAGFNANASASYQASEMQSQAQAQA